ncbi:MAG: hypothetical protein Q9166_000687 [cf. Caloplaca sp. 2 TL-2023]
MTTTNASEDEEENKRNRVRRQPGSKRRRNIMNYQNVEAIPDDEDMASGAISPRTNGNTNGVAVDESGQESSNHDEDEDLENDENHSNSELGDESDLDDALSNGSSINAHRPLEDQDGDLEMADDDQDPPPAIIERQEATPPDSPPQIAVQPIAPIQQAPNDTGNDK